MPDMEAFAKLLAKEIDAERRRPKHPWLTMMVALAIVLLMPAALLQYAFGLDLLHAYAVVWAAALVLGFARAT